MKRLKEEIVLIHTVLLLVRHLALTAPMASNFISSSNKWQPSKDQQLVVTAESFSTQSTTITIHKLHKTTQLTRSLVRVTNRI